MAAAQPLLAGGRLVGDLALHTAMSHPSTTAEPQFLTILPPEARTDDKQIHTRADLCYGSANGVMDQAATGYGTEPCSTAEPLMPSQDTPHPPLGFVSNFMEVQVNHVREGHGGWPQANGTTPGQPNPLVAFVAPLDEFPPLEKGRAMMI